MSIALAYTVHSAEMERAPLKALVNGQTVIADVARLVIEVVADDGDHGHTFRMPVVSDEDLAILREEFKTGAKVTVTLGVSA